MKTITCILLLFLPFFIYAQAPNWQWAKSEGGFSTDEANSVSVDALGNSYITGDFQSPTITFGSTTLINNGDFDFFLVKYDPSGNVLWARSAGGTIDDIGNSLTVDILGNVFVVGYFESDTIIFGSDTLINVDPSGNSPDLFIAKYDANGNVLWAKSVGGNSYDIATSISKEVSGNVFVTGYFNSPTITFGSIQLINSGNSDLFIAKYDPSGNVIWAKSEGGIGDDFSNSISIDNSGNSYVGGSFLSPTIAFGSTVLINADNSGNTFDMFLAKYDSSGNVLWAKRDGAFNYEVARSVSTDPLGNCFVTGYFASPTITFGSTILTNAGNYDSFIAKYDSSGNALWAKSEGGIDYEEGTSISTDASGNCYVIGFFESSAIIFGSTTLTNSGSAGSTQDIFIAKYDAIGNVLWAKSIGGLGYEWPSSIFTDASGTFYLTGYFGSPTITFGSATLANTSSNGDIRDVFIAKSVNGAIGMNSFEESNNGIPIFPNPSSGIFTIQIPTNNSEMNLEIYNSFSEKILSQKILSEKTEIDLSDEVSGIYFVEMSIGKEMFTQKIIIQK